MPAGGGAEIVIAPDGGSISFANLQGFINALGLGTNIANTVRVYVEIAISNLNISVGLGALAVEAASEILSEVVNDIAAAAKASLPAAVDLRDTPPIQEQLSEPGMWEHIDFVNGVYFPTDWIDFWALTRAGYIEGVNVYPPGSVISEDFVPADDWGTPAPGKAEPGEWATNELPPPPKPDETGGVDDMGWYEDLDRDWFGGMLPGGADPGDGGFNPVLFPQFPGGPGGTPPILPPMGPIPPGGGGGLPPMPPGNNCGPASCAAPVWKKVCGQYRWVYGKRRRRKRLASKGDLADLAALKGILGGGKAFEVWIATHS